MTYDQLLVVDEKAIRARAISRYMAAAGYERAVCFTCGNSAAALRRHGIPVLEIGSGPDADLRPTRWWTPGEIHAVWPTYFDATSGHLPAPLMAEVASLLRDELGELDTQMTWFVPTGSGETISCLRWAYPTCHFTPTYGAAPAVQRDQQAPLRQVAEAPAGYVYHPQPAEMDAT